AASPPRGPPSAPRPGMPRGARGAAAPAAAYRGRRAGGPPPDRAPSWPGPACVPARRAPARGSRPPPQHAAGPADLLADLRDVLRGGDRALHPLHGDTAEVGAPRRDLIEETPHRLGHGAVVGVEPHHPAGGEPFRVAVRAPGEV